MFKYPVKIETDTVGVLLSCRDLPDYYDSGDTIDDALSHAIKGIENAISIYIDQGIPVPMPSSILEGEQYVMVSTISSMKIDLHNALVASGISKSELARRMQIHNQIVNRLFDLTHKSKFDQLESAFNALGKSILVTVVNAA